MNRTQFRVGRNSLPSNNATCLLTCVYINSTNHICDMPRVNKQNDDSTCHNMLNKDLLKSLLLDKAVIELYDSLSDHDKRRTSIENVKTVISAQRKLNLHF